jgi:hypothetical protein
MKNPELEIGAERLGLRQSSAAFEPDEAPDLLPKRQETIAVQNLKTWRTALAFCLLTSVCNGSETRHNKPSSNP